MEVAAEQVVESRAAEDSPRRRRTLRLKRGVRWSPIEEAKKAKSQYNWDRYEIEVQRAHAGDPDSSTPRSSTEVVELA